MQDIRNKQTISILRGLKQKGPPAGDSTVSLDMTMPSEDDGEKDVDEDAVTPPTPVTGVVAAETPEERRKRKDRGRI